jgi:hypothetical protein
MKHAGPAALDTLEELLTRIRSHAELREKSRGCFYRKSKAFLHFHEDPEGMFADLKIGNDFARSGSRPAPSAPRSCASSRPS